MFAYQSSDDNAPTSSHTIIDAQPMGASGRSNRSSGVTLIAIWYFASSAITILLIMQMSKFDGWVGLVLFTDIIGVGLSFGPWRMLPWVRKATIVCRPLQSATVRPRWPPAPPHAAFAPEPGDGNGKPFYWNRALDPAAEERQKPGHSGLIERLRHVYWLGGSPCAGKSSVAMVLAERHGLQLYSCDDHFEEHNVRLDADRHPTFASLAALTCDELWMRPVTVQVETEIAYCREVFGMIFEDLLLLPSYPSVIAEGTDLLPECVKPLRANASHGFWLVPTAEFQYHYYSKRSWISDILKDCTQPVRAFSNWMGRDAGFADRVEESAYRLKLPVLRVDGSLPLQKIASIVEHSFGLSAG